MIDDTLPNVPANTLIPGLRRHHSYATLGVGSLGVAFCVAAGLLTSLAVDKLDDATLPPWLGAPQFWLLSILAIVMGTPGLSVLGIFALLTFSRKEGKFPPHQRDFGRPPDDSIIPVVFVPLAASWLLVSLVAGIQLLLIQADVSRPPVPWWAWCLPLSGLPAPWVLRRALWSWKVRSGCGLTVLTEVKLGEDCEGVVQLNPDFVPTSDCLLKFEILAVTAAESDDYRTSTVAVWESLQTVKLDRIKNAGSAWNVPFRFKLPDDITAGRDPVRKAESYKWSLTIQTRLNSSPFENSFTYPALSLVD